jgi:four helix bundle protein
MPKSRRFDFEKLDAFDASLDAAESMEKLVARLPEGRGYVRDQLRRAANSVVLNTGEGAGEFQPLEKARLYRLARRSATECAAQILLCRRLGLLDAQDAEPALDALERVISLLVATIRRCGDRARAAANA